MSLQADTQLCSRDIRIAVDHLGISLVDLNSFGDDAADTPRLMVWVVVGGVGTAKLINKPGESLEPAPPR